MFARNNSEEMECDHYDDVVRFTEYSRLALIKKAEETLKEVVITKIPRARITE